MHMAHSQVDPVWPAIATLLLAFFVARAFASVYECVVGTHAESGLLMAPQLGSPASLDGSGPPGAGLLCALKRRAAQIATSGCMYGGRRRLPKA